MKKLLTPILLSFGAGMALITQTTALAQAEPKQAQGQLHFQSAVTRDDLQGVNSVEISRDGQFLSATPWPSGAIVVFRRDGSNGALSHVQTFSDDSLRGDTGLALSPASDQAVAACFMAHSAVLMHCDPKTGKLKAL